MAVFMTVAIPVWTTQAQREKEAELIFRGEQYGRAVMLYQRKFANALPPSLDVLLNDRYLRKKYKDPITNGDFQLLSGASAQANSGVPGGLGTAGAGGRAGSAAPGTTTSGTSRPGGTGTTTTTGRGTTTSGVGSNFGLGAGVGAGAGGSVPGGIMGVTSTSSAKSLRLYNGRGAYNEWTFVPVQRNLAAGTGAEGADTPDGGRGGRGGRGRGPNTPTPGRGGESFRPGGSSGGNSPFRPSSGGFGGRSSGNGR
jgi:hypothetical protein